MKTNRTEETTQLATLVALIALLSAGCGQSEPAGGASDEDVAAQKTDVGAGSDAGSDAVADAVTADSAPSAQDALAQDAGGPQQDGAQQDASATQQDGAQQDAGPAQQDTAAGSQDAGAQDAAKTDAGPAPGVVCGGAQPKFPAFSKTCKVDGDCAASLHQINCCGTTIAVGMNKSELAAFEANEAACTKQYPDCGCASTATIAEDGKPVGSLSGVVARCIGGVCLSTSKAKSADCTELPGGAPKPFKWCQQTADCTTTLHTVDCCGTAVAWGVTKTSKALIDKTELACNEIKPICDCMPKPSKAEDGQSTTDTAKLAAKCAGGMCTSYVKP